MLACALALAGCGRTAGPPAPPPAEALDAALRPAAQVAALRRLAGAHFTATARFRVSPAGGARSDDEQPAAPDAVTTTTELWLDEKGDFRLVESNDHDGGREVVRHGRDLAVALRHGKLIRRPAQEPEPTRLLEEAVGAPWAAWEAVRRFAAVEPAAGGAYRIARGAEPRPAAPPAAAPGPLRQWRETIAVEALAGEARLDERTGALLAFRLEARFTARREDQPLEGEIAVEARLDGIGSTPPVAAPEAEELRVRQRTVLEERALLGDLPRKEAR